MLFVALISVVGFLFAYRISLSLIGRAFFTKSELTKIGTVIFSVIIGAIFFLPKTFVCAWSAIIFPFVIAGILLSVAVNRRSKIFRTRFIEVLSLIILKMKSGRSFRQSLIESSVETDTLMRAKLSEISSVVVFSQQKSRPSSEHFIVEVINEFAEADRQPHSAMKRLCVFRDKLKIEENFRRRSGQVLARTRAQSLIMGGLYLAVLTFMICKFGWKSNSDLMLASFAFFSAGALWIFASGRWLRWKV
jgi:hypothetical protein